MSTIPQGLDPALEFVLRAIAERDPNDLTRTWWRVEAGAGLGKDALRKWLYRQPGQRGPSLELVRRGLNELGYDLEVVPLDRREAA